MSLLPTLSGWTRENNPDSSRVFIPESSSATEMPSAPLPRKKCFEKFRSAVNNPRIVLIVSGISHIVFITVICILVYCLERSNNQKDSIKYIPVTCPPDWIGYHGRCYNLSRDEKNWMESLNDCISHNASLAKITKEEMDFVTKLTQKHVFWIGLKREPDQPWKWPDGENATLDVSGNGGDCAYLYDDATANSGTCGNKHRYICQKEIDFMRS